MSLAQLARWWDSGWPRLEPRKRRAWGRAKPRTSFRPQLLALEDRCLLCTVTNPNDSGPGSLRQCIIDEPSGGRVDFADGLSGPITLSSTLTINKILTINGPGDSVITVSGNHARQVFNIPAPWMVTISGLTIANGNAGGTGGGGGIFDGGVLTITDCTLSGNATGFNGGGISNSGTLTITNSVFSGNFADAAGGRTGGGGIFNTGSGTVTITNSIFSGNSTGGEGGGIARSGGTLTITNSFFSGNSASGSGGGIYNTGTMTVTSSIFSGNSAGNGGGGGIRNTGGLTVTSSTLSGNSATGNGGGGGILSSGTLTVTSSTLSGNSSSSSGGGINKTGGGNVAIDRSTFTLNAAVTGAGISYTGTGMVTLTSSTLSGNFAGNGGGGGIFHTGNGMVIPDNNIVAGNHAPTSSIDVMGAVNSQGYNLIGDGTGSSGWDPSNGDMIGTADMLIDPLLGPLHANGGPTVGAPGNSMVLETEALSPGSPALNAGDPAELGTPDQRGVVRSGGVNIGAYQASATAFVVTARKKAEAGTPFDVTVTAKDPFGQVAVGYTGTATFSSADPYGAALPADYTFQLSDGGTVTFAAGAALYTAGTWDITATDPDNGITGTTNVRVQPAPADHLQILAPATVSSGMAFDVTVVAQDPYGNTATHYRGTVTWTSTDPDPSVVLPADATFRRRNAGQVTFAGGVTLITVGGQTITATDTTSGISGSAMVTVSSPGLPANGQRARNPLAAPLESAITCFQSTALTVPLILGSASSDGGRLESEEVNDVLPARRQEDRPVVVLHTRPVDLGLGNGPVPPSDDSLPVLTAGAVDATFANGSLDRA